jgi:hypothetical protein
MESLQVSATFPAIAPEHAAEFKQLAAEALELVQSEPGTLQYDWFFSPDGTRCVVRETYANSDAVLEHLGHVGPMLGRMVELGGGLELDIFGAPSKAVSEALAAMNPNMYEYSQGK